jgi:hypothetical protein
VDDYSMRGRAGAEGLGRVFGTLPLRQGWLGPALHFCASTSRLPMPLTKSERPGPRPPSRSPRGSIWPPTGARGKSIYPRRGPINTDDPCAAINPPQPKGGR